MFPYHFMRCGLSPLRKLNELCRYSRKNFSFLMFARSTLSTVFWSSARAVATGFFWADCQYWAPNLVRIAAWAKTDLWLLALLEEGLLACGLLLLLGSEVPLLADLLYRLAIDSLKIHLVRRGNDIAGVDPPEGNTVDFERTGHQQDALREVLEEDDTLSPEAAGKEDEDGARLKSLPWLRRLDGLAHLYRS